VKKMCSKLFRDLVIKYDIGWKGTESQNVFGVLAVCLCYRD